MRFELSKILRKTQIFFMVSTALIIMIVARGLIASNIANYTNNKTVQDNRHPQATDYGASVNSANSANASSANPPKKDFTENKSNHSTVLSVVGSSQNPSKIGSSVLISGSILQEGNTDFPNSPVEIEYLRDQILWQEISTVNADSAGLFKVQYVFPLSGKYTIRAICDGQEITFVHIVADSFVNPSGSEDFVDIQSAIDSLPATGGLVYVRSGLYDLGGKPLVLRSNLTLIGDGIDKTVVRLYPTLTNGSSNVEDEMTSDSEIDNVDVENFTLIQNVIPQNHHGGIVLRGQESQNITIADLKVTTTSGAGISIPNFENLLIEHCIIENTWTGITFNDGSNGTIRGNIITNTTGDAIGSGRHVTDIVIESNEIENVGDTGIDISSQSWVTGNQPHERIVARNNTLENCGVRVTNSIDVLIEQNNIENGTISIDAGQGTPINVSVVGNNIVSEGSYGIGFKGASNSLAENNTIIMEQQSTSGNQSGIIAAIWGTGLIINNTIINPANFGIDFGGWALGGSSNITISKNIIRDFGNFGIYDDDKKQDLVYIEENIITSSKEGAGPAILTQYPSNQWLISNNILGT